MQTPVQVEMQVTVPPFHALQANTQQGARKGAHTTEKTENSVYINEHCTHCTQSTQPTETLQVSDASHNTDDTQNIPIDETVQNLDIESQQLVELPAQQDSRASVLLHRHMGLLNINMFGIRLGLPGSRAQFYAAYGTHAPEDAPDISDACANV